MDHQDPSALRAKAAAIRDRADALRAMGDRLDRRVDGLSFQGPAAARLRTATAERTRQALTAAQELDEVADRVSLAAAHAEQHAGS